MLADNTGALKGLKVVELGQLIAGPFCGQLLGDMGADVVKIEPPGAGDPMRQWGNGEHKVWWEVIGRNKRSVTANLRERDGQELARKLLADADIMIENFKPGTMEKWGLDPARLHALNPGLIIVRISGYGQTGPYAARAGFGGVAESMGGWRAIVGDPDQPPSRMGVSIGDTLTATYACMGALAALRARETTGQGQVIDAALYESVLQVMESLVAEYDVMGIVRQRSGSILPGIAPSNVYRCADGEYMIGANGDAIFARLTEAMGQPELASDPRYATHIARGENQTELDQLIERWTLTLTIDQLEALMVEYSIPAGRIFRAPDMLADPQYQAREAIVSLPNPDHGTVRMQACFPKLSETPSTIRRIAPRFPGEHNAEVYGERLGLDAAALADLAARGLI
ncbi:putative CoA-transferase [Caenibius tardaugens NBRC 16725]|uniref:Putative CoA-transferase n=1 Tax=Caenibius tardaugens NBRC 16725 TaxID=1219035 RepID=U2YIA3_9SPHN|nr:CoA transferase [Caenibius tardaugens]AZI36989.1 CoA transferase [Caenibius tardaugens NBRC 16725]GAD47792.1 putative CoA-transferase [Caenibius tardaugens NBRC 16725]